MVRKKSGILITTVLSAILLFILSSPVWADDKIEASKQFNNNCLKCHGAQGLKSYSQGKDISLYVNEEDYKDSIHGTNACSTCHEGITSYPHAGVKYGREFAIEVNQRCQKCHADINKVYMNSDHGKQLINGNKETALCSDCHGIHNINKTQNLKANTSGNNQTVACLKCHEEIKESYMESYHGKAVYQGSTKAARCSDCHGSHDILGPASPASSVNKANVPKTCATCHVKANKNFAEGNEHWVVKKDGPGSSTKMYYTVKFFSWLLFLCISFLLVHMLLELYRKYQNAKK